MCKLPVSEDPHLWPVLQTEWVDFNVNFNSVQRALVLVDYAPPALRVQGLGKRVQEVWEKKRKKGKKCIIIIINKKLTG